MKHDSPSKPKIVLVLSGECLSILDMLLLSQLQVEYGFTNVSYFSKAETATLHSLSKTPEIVACLFDYHIHKDIEEFFQAHKLSKKVLAIPAGMENAVGIGEDESFYISEDLQGPQLGEIIREKFGPPPDYQGSPETIAYPAIH